MSVTHIETFQRPHHMPSPYPFFTDPCTLQDWPNGLDHPSYLASNCQGQWAAPAGDKTGRKERPSPALSQLWAVFLAVLTPLHLYSFSPETLLYDSISHLSLPLPLQLLAVLTSLWLIPLTLPTLVQTVHSLKTLEPSKLKSASCLALSDGTRPSLAKVITVLMWLS